MRTGAVEDGVLSTPERAVLDAVEARLAAEARRRFGAQRRQMGPAHRPRSLPHTTLLGIEPGRAAWSPRVLFPRREEFLLATVVLRAGGEVHACEVVAVNGRVWAVLASPPLPPGVGCQIDSVRLGADPMTPCRPRARPSEGADGAPGSRGLRHGQTSAGVWTILSDPGRGEGGGDGVPVVAVGRRGTLLVGRRDRSGGVFRVLAPERPPVTLRARRLEEAFREASRLSGP